nr:hypothetical protein [Tanacetum cinerariifolium]
MITSQLQGKLWLYDEVRTRLYLVYGLIAAVVAVNVDDDDKNASEEEETPAAKKMGKCVRRLAAVFEGKSQPSLKTFSAKLLTRLPIFLAAAVSSSSAASSSSPTFSATTDVISP